MSATTGIAREVFSWYPAKPGKRLAWAEYTSVRRGSPSTWALARESLIANLDFELVGVSDDVAEPGRVLVSAGG